jgi:hypothetical protein
MERDGFEFDLLTQRFIENRWETEIGKKVLEEVIDGIKNGVEVRAILDDYVLDHPENQDPYGHPYYPKDAMSEDSFWVITHDDLRGIHVYNDKFPNNSSFTVKSLNYARFYNCKFNGTNLERTSLTRTVFEKCNLDGVCFAGGGGYSTYYKNCNLIKACFWNTALIEAGFSGSDLTDAYFESSTLTDLIVNYLSIFDRHLNTKWKTRQMPENQKPEILKAIRIAYEKAELWSNADQYLFLERKSNRKEIVWNKFISNKNIGTFGDWLSDWLWGVTTGYEVKPSRILVLGLFIAMVFTLIYYFSGNPGADNGIATSLYYSLTTFATLGYGDLHYTETRWIMRLLSTAEALSGAALIAAYIAVMARKVIRH